MYCKYCGEEIDNNVTYCPFCGKKIKEDKEKKPSKCWANFARISRILSIVSVSTCIIPFIGMFTGIPGIVLSRLGKKATDDVSAKNAKTGFILSIVGTSVSFLMYFILIIISILLIETPVYY